MGSEPSLIHRTSARPDSGPSVTLQLSTTTRKRRSWATPRPSYKPLRRRCGADYSIMLHDTCEAPDHFSYWPPSQTAPSSKPSQLSRNIACPAQRRRNRASRRQSARRTTTIAAAKTMVSKSPAEPEQAGNSASAGEGDCVGEDHLPLSICHMKATPPKAMSRVPSASSVTSGIYFSAFWCFRILTP